MSRNDKGRAISRYLTGSTGIPSLYWNNTTVESPPPYDFTVTTARKLMLWHEHIRGGNHGIPIAIRYDHDLDSVADAWVGMRLEHFAPLLKAHYESISDRINTHLLGD